MNTYERFKALLDSRKVTSYKVSKETHIASSTLSEWKNGKHEPSAEKIKKIADYFNVPMDYFYGEEQKELETVPFPDDRAMIPILGRVPAGIPIDAIQDIKGYIDVPSSWVDNHGALLVKGDSMYPEYHDGDIVIYRYTPTCENGDDCIVYVNGDDATIKKVVLKEDGIILQPLNPRYDPMFFENGEGLTIGGVVVEIRRRKK